MSLVCAITNEIPEIPVLSPVSGCIFERRIIEKYLSEKEVDPINGEILTSDMLIEVKTTSNSSSLIVKPRPPSATSIPALLKSLQDEWDALMLHSFTIRQQLQTTRQELSHALYQHDAACRVIARLNKEVAAAREALATLKPQVQAIPAAISIQNMEEEVSEKGKEDLEGMTEKVIQKLQDRAAILTSERKKRLKTMPEDLTKPDTIKTFKQTSSHLGLHSASDPGILCLDISILDPSKVVTGGNDKNAVIFDSQSNQVIATFKGHTKKVSSTIYHNERDCIITASWDKTIRIWDVPNENCVKIIKAHLAPITGISLHPTGDYILSSSLDETWAFSDINSSGKIVCKVKDSTPLTCIQFHPDGLIFGAGGQDAIIKIWDLKEKSNVANFPGHSGPISALSFSENGYYLATSADDSLIKLWDLRKLKNFKTISLLENEEDVKYDIKCLSFDSSGNYLAVAGNDVRIYLAKQWNLLANFSNPGTEKAHINTGVKFGPNASFLASTGMDRALRFYST
ncbi:unnamed protein product [Gordionus sp. m RMFG-2023]|uniref:pre-mRNA-processing factor 19-like n=1 Tax=Gordionus sp. m RMFG-2023 TaxID=3053472 RepID=UPI0030E43ABA